MKNKMVDIHVEFMNEIIKSSKKHMKKLSKLELQKDEILTECLSTLSAAVGIVCYLMLEEIGEPDWECVFEKQKKLINKTIEESVRQGNDLLLLNPKYKN